MATKQLFDDEAIQEHAIPGRVEGIVDHFTKALKRIKPDAPGVHSGAARGPLWIEQAVRLKQTMMVGPHDYRVQYCAPDTPFDRSWMNGVLPNGRQVDDDEDVSSKGVALCLYPGLMQQAVQPLHEAATIAQALTKNRTFFSSYKEKSAQLPKTCITKAFVLLL